MAPTPRVRKPSKKPTRGGIADFLRSSSRQAPPDDGECGDKMPPPMTPPTEASTATGSSIGSATAPTTPASTIGGEVVITRAEMEMLSRIRAMIGNDSDKDRLHVALLWYVA